MVLISVPELRLRSGDKQRAGLSRQQIKLPDMGAVHPAVQQLIRSKTELSPAGQIPSPRRSVTNLEPRTELNEIAELREVSIFIFRNRHFLPRLNSQRSNNLNIRKGSRRYGTLRI